MSSIKKLKTMPKSNNIFIFTEFFFFDNKLIIIYIQLDLINIEFFTQMNLLTFFKARYSSITQSHSSI